MQNGYNKGSYIRDWNTVLMNIVKEIDFLKGFYKKDNYLKTLTIKNLIKKGERCKRRGIQKYFDNATYKSGCQTIKRLKALKWIEMLMNNDGISSEWLKKSPIGDDTYINLLLRNINEKLKA